MAEATYEQPATETDPAETWQPWLNRLAASRRRRDDRIGEWQDNVDRRAVKSRRTSSAESSSLVTSTNVSVPKDWSLTKAKIAQLYSQTPEVRLEARWPEFEGATQAFGKELNDTLTACNIGATIEEELADVVNASGLAAVIISCDKRTKEVQMPVMDPVIAMMTGIPADQIPTRPVTQVADIQYLVDRLSPSDVLIPTDFIGSDYNKCRWIGRDGRMTWSQGVTVLGLTEDEKENVLGRDKRTGRNATLTNDPNQFRDSEVVNFTEVFYWRHYYHEDETSFSAIQRLVFVDGLDEPKINEPYTAQVRQPDGKMAGVTRLPIQAFALTYISDESLPPSDTAVGKYQVDELEASRTAMRDQRKHSMPFRWGNTNLVSTNMRNQIDNGDPQKIIWVNGPGDRAFGEVSRAAYPQERFEFDAVIGNDLTEIYQVGTNQAGAFAKGERSAREAGIIEKNFQRRVGLEQDKVQKHFLAIAEVVAGHLAVYGTFTLPDELGANRQLLANAFVYSVRVDSTVRLDAEEQIDRASKGLNLTAQSGYVNPKEPIRQIWSLLGFNPDRIVIDPQPKAPEPVKVSVSKAEDLMNPLFVALLMRTGQGPTPEDLAAAKQLLKEAGMPTIPILPPEPDGNGVPRDPETPGISNPSWETSPRIERRAEDGGA